MFNLLIIVALYLAVTFIVYAITESLDIYTDHCNNKSYEHCYQVSIMKSEGITIMENRDDLWSAIRK